MTKRKTVGFTLIELLVVIAIIAILAAILFPVFSQAREKARQAACLNNAKNMGMAAQMYTDDSDETYPPVRFGAGRPCWSPAPYYTSWRILAQPYLRNWKIFDCPSFPDLQCSEEWRETGREKSPYPQYMDYQLNGSQFCYSQNRRKWDIARFTGPGLAGPASLIFIQEGGLQCAPDTGTWCNWVFRRETARHNGGKNYVFADGHAKWMKPQQTTSPVNMWIHVRRNPDDRLEPGTPYDFTCNDNYQLP
jgi:prepilin-type N-terminal cleavage/methylation domain-containing protein/prepilin-type processing-associated H-X9-DG protein